jgi:hypothetical protein
VAIIVAGDALPFDEENEVRPDVLRAQEPRRLAEVLGERGDPVDIGLDRWGERLRIFMSLIIR